VEAWGHRLGEQKKEHDEWDKYSEAMLERCKRDVSLQYKILAYLHKEGEGMGWTDAHRLNVKIFKYLQEQETRGFQIDTKHLDASVATLERWIDRINRSLIPHLPSVVDVLETKKDGEYNYVRKPFKKDGNLTHHMVRFMGNEQSNIIGGPFCRVCIRPVDLDSTLEVKDFLLEQGWKPKEWNEKDGKRTSAKLSKDDPFEGITTGLGRLVSKRIQCRQRKGVLEGWRQALRDDGRISTPVNGIATTGRLRHRLVVNIPSPHSKAFFAKQMRQCFVASKDMVLVGCDSEGNQMRQLAGRMKDDEFTTAVLHGEVAQGTDLHSLNQRRSGAKSRSLAKNFFYGSVLFGAGDKKTAEILSTTVNQAKEIKKKYFEEMPKLSKLIEKLVKEWRISAKKRFNPKWNRMEYYDGYFRGIDGRSILVPYEKDLLCYALQSDEAIQMGVAYVMLHKWAAKKGWTDKDWGMLIWMHDEFQMECRPAIRDELGHLACASIRWAGEWLKMGCPHDGGYLVGDNWYETH
jgi:DNA polymerase-1